VVQVEHPNTDVEQQWRKAVSLQRKRAVMACFRMIPVYNISRSAAAPFHLAFICTDILNSFSLEVFICICTYVPEFVNGSPATGCVNVIQHIVCLGCTC